MILSLILEFVPLQYLGICLKYYSSVCTNFLSGPSNKHLFWNTISPTGPQILLVRRWSVSVACSFEYILFCFHLFLFFHNSCRIGQNLPWLLCKSVVLLQKHTNACFSQLKHSTCLSFSFKKGAYLWFIFLSP